MATENYSYVDLNNEINLESGGIDFSIVTYTDAKDDKKFISVFESRGKFLEDKLEFAYRILPEILFTSKFDDKKRLKEVLLMLKSRMASSMISAGHSTAVGRAMSYLSPTSKYVDEVNGITLYDLVCDYVENYDAKADELISKINEVKDIVLNRANLMVDFTGSKSAFDEVKSRTAEFIKKLDSSEPKRNEWKAELECKNEGFKTASQVQYVAKAANYKDKGLEYNGALKVLKVMMGYDYLWMNIRVKGGAYGCMSGFARQGDTYFSTYRDPHLRSSNEIFEGIPAYGCMSAFTRSGECYMVSYRDPHLKETIEVYNGAAEYLKNFDASERDMTKYVIGSISDMDTPLNPKAKGLRSLAAYLGNYTYEMAQKERDEVLSCNVEVIRGLSKYAEVIKDSEYVCAVGSEEKIKNASDVFKTTRTLA